MLPSLVLEHRNAYLAPLVGGTSLRIHYVECKPETLTSSNKPKGILLLIHGFPQTSYQFRHVMIPFAKAGYRVIAPDYRGAGESSHPLQGYDKVTMASDLHRLLTEHFGLQKEDRVHIIGHDIGAMVAYAYATEYPQFITSIIWGECPLPGSCFFDKCRYDIGKFHFTFHCVPDGLPEALVMGRERLYLKQFFSRQISRSDGVDEEAFDHYVKAYSLPDGMRAAFEVYRAFEEDKRRNVAHLSKHGKSSVPNLILSGQSGAHSFEAQSMASEFFQDVKVDVVEDSDHYIAEENPDSFITKVCSFLHTTET